MQCMLSTPPSQTSPLSSWPTGVTSLNDAYQFAKLICGPNATVLDYASRLPHTTTESFLLVVRGGCKNGPLSYIGDCIEQLHNEVKTYESETRHNSQNPAKAISMGSKTVSYHSAQLSCNPCTCRSQFGADANQKLIPTCSANWTAGRRFHRILHSVLSDNHKEAYQNSQGNCDAPPVWLKKTWHAVMNCNDHRQNHGIDYHADISDCYNIADPIASFSFGHGGVLTLKSKYNKRLPERMLFQEDGDVLIMAGKFQQEFDHGVPARRDWKWDGDIGSFLSDWEKNGLEREMKLHRTQGDLGAHKRLNCTLRWNHYHHQFCPCNPCRAQIGSPVPPPISIQQPDPTHQIPVLSGIKRARDSTEAAHEVRDAVDWKRFAEELLETCWLHFSIENELGFLKSWSIGGSHHVAKSPIQALDDVANKVLEKKDKISKVSNQLKKLPISFGYQVDFSLYDLVDLACKHLRNVYECSEKLNVHGGRNNFFFACSGVHTQNRLKNTKDGNWKKYILNHNQILKLLLALDAKLTVDHNQLALKVEDVMPGILPRRIKYAMQTIQKTPQHLILEEVDCWQPSKVLLIKAFEIGFVPTENAMPPPTTRLQTRQDLLREVFTEENKCSAIIAVQEMVSAYMSFLQCVDNRKEFFNTPSDAVFERYDMYFWAQEVDGICQPQPDQQSKPV